MSDRTSDQLADAFEQYVHERGYVRLGAEKKRLLAQFADWLRCERSSEQLDAERYRFLRSEGPEVAQLIRALVKHREATLTTMDTWVDRAIYESAQAGRDAPTVTGEQ